MNYYEAVVADVADPEKRGRLRLRCAVLLNAKDLLPGWIEPTFAFAGAGKGLFLLPAVGDVVRLVAEAPGIDDGDADVANPEWRWECQAWQSASSVPDILTGKAYGKKVGLVFGSGQYLILDSEASALILACATIKLGADAAHNVCLADVLQTILSSCLTTITTWANAHTHTVTVAAFGTPVVSLAAVPQLDLSSAQSDIDGTTWLSQSVLAGE